MPAPPNNAVRSASTRAPGPASRDSATTRAEYPPPQYWRAWAADAEPPALPAPADLPVAEPPLPPVVPPPAADGSAEAPYRVLIVEDDISQALFAESILAGSGMATTVVSVASEMMAAMTAAPPDLVLMDLHMPGMSGTELTNQIRQHSAFAHTPIVFLTGDTDPERQLEALEVGGDDFLAKPVRPRHLIAAVQSRVMRARALQQQRSGTDRHRVTGLFTRHAMLRLLTDAVPGATAGAIHFLEIEGIGALRDRFGYGGLETVLADAGRAIATIAGDAPVSRLSDNFFVVYSRDVSDDQLVERARSLRDGLGRQSFSVHDETIRLRTLVGYAGLSLGFVDASSALAAAEQALRDARASAIGIAAYQRPVEVDADGDAMQAIHDAFAGDRFELAFQPVVAVAGGDEAQYQTLLRMRDGEGELHTAAEILPAAEASGMLHEIDLRVLKLAVAVLAERRASRPVRLFVSQSPRTLARERYAATVVELLGEHDIDGASLVVDVRQDDALIHALALKEFCAAMVPAGIQLCLSQYQAGVESDALLAQLPLGFVRLAARYSSRLDEPAVRDEMRAAIERAHRLGLQVIGQQVEDPQAAATLWMSGVDFIQGNLVQRAAGGLDFDFQHSVL